MQDVSGFLKKFSHLLRQKENTVGVCADVLKDVCGVLCEKSDLKIKNKTLVTKFSAGEKSQLFIKKQQIITKINTELGKTVITEIR